MNSSWNIESATLVMELADKWFVNDDLSDSLP